MWAPTCEFVDHTSRPPLRHEGISGITPEPVLHTQVRGLPTTQPKLFSDPTQGVRTDSVSVHGVFGEGQGKGPSTLESS